MKTWQIVAIGGAVAVGGYLVLGKSKPKPKPPAQNNIVSSLIATAPSVISGIGSLFNGGSSPTTSSSTPDSFTADGLSADDI